MAAENKAQDTQQRSQCQNMHHVKTHRTKRRIELFHVFKTLTLYKSKKIHKLKEKTFTQNTTGQAT